MDSARTWRGGQNQVLLASRGMSSRGHTVALACQQGSVLEGRARQAGVEVHSLSFHGDLSPKAASQLRALIAKFEPEIVHAHDPHAIAASVLSGSRRRLLATRRVDFRLRGPLSRLKYRACRGVIAVSEAIARVLVDEGLPGERIRVVYEGVSDRNPEPGGREAFAEWGVPATSPVVGNVAHLTSHKDHETLLRAIPYVLARLPETYFVIVGDGELRGRLESLVQELQIAHRCRFTGFRTDLDRLIPAFTVFCLSSRLEGLGTSLLDAMAFARPIVATSAGGIPEAVKEGITGRLVAPGDPKGLAEALLAVLSDPSRQESFGRAGRSRFLECFTSERMVDGTLEAYGTLR